MRTCGLPPLAELDRILSYNPAGGEFRHRVARGSRRRGDLAGCRRDNGYIVIRIAGTLFKAHRLAWYFVHGQDPGKRVIDHANGLPWDNRIANLRIADHALNGMNSKLSRANTSGHKGVYPDTQDPKKWRVTCCNHWVGRYDTFEDAVNAYRKVAKKRAGEFARFK